ncbi:NADPH-dependent FMN reductase [Vibrio sp. VB16]|uniref:NADPH-dependent FMN reductase n=1 Tax=Vibrio sp. VB16 TaxID=2785746 RepID=UPI00189E0862|nr:NAD(P)H-dependent oxidoreductase [Vibrio sp. VB16]UGA53538.1 NAD(P)H-dependent oxidoreductase [Vibrio sp. VB16]
MKLTIIAGSQRAQSQSLNVAHYLSSVAQPHFDQIKVFDLHEQNLPFWNEGVWGGTDEWAPWREMAKELESSDAFVFITPEWHGMATPALKNFLLLTTDNELAHKPALAVSVSASVNGVYPISELRMTASKNNHVCLLPDHLIFRDIETLLDKEFICKNEHIAERSQYTIGLLAAYAQALQPVHKSMLDAGKPFRYGM